MSGGLPCGIYDALLDTSLQDLLSRSPELRSVLGKLDPEEQPAKYADFVAKLVYQVLREETDPARRLEICNNLLAHVQDSCKESANIGQLVPEKKSVLLEITPPHFAQQGIPRPQTSISESSLFTGSARDPQLVHELQAEMKSADSVDILVSFIK
ncbi:MAG: NgoFVII family restriction endonuclease, partial [Desulfovermiculus sp.]